MDTAMFLKYLSIILQILNKGTRCFSNSLVVENLSLFFFFFFLRHLQNQSGMLLSVQRSLELGSFSSLSSQVAFKGMSENLGKSSSVSAQFTGHVLYFSSLYQSFQDTDRRIFQLNLLRTRGLSDLNPPKNIRSPGSSGLLDLRTPTPPSTGSDGTAAPKIGSQIHGPLESTEVIRLNGKLETHMGPKIGPRAGVTLKPQLPARVTFMKVQCQDSLCEFSLPLGSRAWARVF